MNRQLSAADLANLPQAIPLLTKRHKLVRLAYLVRNATHQIAIFNGVEYMHPAEKRRARHPLSVFALAATDPLLRDAGMQDDSVAEGQRFFDLSNTELHVFSCDCGGHMSNETMARRLENLAAHA